MKKIEAIIRKSRFEDVKKALLAADIEWFSYYNVRGEGKMRQARIYRGVMYDTDCLFSKTDLHWLPPKSSLSFTLCSFSATKLIHFVSILKKIKTFRFYFLSNILNLSRLIIFSLQFVRQKAFL